jgi:uncharacterized protein
MPSKTDRREFFKDTMLSAGGILLGKSLMGYSAVSETGISPYYLMDEVNKYRKIDCHIHINLYNPSSEEQIMDYSDRLGIDKVVLSRPVTEGEGAPEQVIEYNNMIISMMKKYPKRVLGQVFVNPRYPKESLEEIKRCIDQGMIGLKLYHQAKINDPLLYPIIEKFIDLKMMILMHAECQLGIAGYRMKYDQKARPNASTPEDFVDAAKRYPEAMFQFAHIGGGGDWEYECKMIRDYPNIYVDTSGSNNEENMIDFALQYLGEDRLFFASDNSFYQGVGKVFASNLTDFQKKKLFFDNYAKILKKGGYDVN